MERIPLNHSKPKIHDIKLPHPRAPSPFMFQLNIVAKTTKKIIHWGGEGGRTEFNKTQLKQTQLLTTSIISVLLCTMVAKTISQSRTSGWGYHMAR